MKLNNLNHDERGNGGNNYEIEILIFIVGNYRRPIGLVEIVVTLLDI